MVMKLVYFKFVWVIVVFFFPINNVTDYTRNEIFIKIRLLNVSLIILK